MAKDRGKTKAAKRTPVVQAARTRSAWLGILVAVGGVVAYANSFQGPFLFDDVGHIVQNERIRSLWPIGVHLTHRRPVVSTSLAVNYALSEYEVWSYHAFNIAVHALAALTLFGVIRRTLQRRPTKAYADPRSDWLAFVIALIWVVHPLATQSVSYIIQRGEALMGLFYLLTIYCLVRGVRSARSVWWYVVAVVSCGLGMASKAVMVTAPIVVLLYDLVFVSASLSEPFRRRWGLYLGLAATWSVLFACGIVRGVFDTSLVGTVGFSYKEITPGQYLLTQPGVLMHYLKLVLWPRHLCLDYDWSITASIGAVVPGLILVLLLLGGSIWALIRKPWLGFLGAWFFLILLPTSSFIPIKDPIFEHRMYLPLAAVIIAVTVGVDALFRVVVQRWGGPPAALRVARIALVVIVVAALGWRTLQRNRDYRTRVAMWESVLAQQPASARAHLNLGVALSEEAGDLDGAIQACQKSVELDPTWANAHFRLGQILSKAGKTLEAANVFREAIRLDRSYTDAYYSLGNALYELNQPEAAAEQYRLAIRTDPAYVSAWVNLGNALRVMGRPDEAIEAYRQGVEAKPDFADARFNLGVALAEQGRLKEAVAALRKTLEYDPNHAPALRGLGNALYTQGKVDEAIAVYRTARRLAPQHPGVHFNLGNALLDKGKYDEAIKSYKEVLRLRPDFTPAREAINDALQRKQQDRGRGEP